ncbi:MAG: hypothetical protein Q8L81_09630 [Bacteroidota bacterium]|nr:hypothetical protein [Bacteroidota bacterium]
MKKIIFIYSLILSSICYGQATKEEIKTIFNEEAIKMQDSVKKTLKLQIDSLKEFILNNLEDTEDHVGKIEFRKGTHIAVYEDNKKFKTTHAFDKTTGNCNCPDTYYAVKHWWRKKCVCKTLPIELVDSLHIDSMYFRIKDGDILEVQVIGKMKGSGSKLKFSNQNSPILLTSERFGKKDRLRGDVQQNRFVVLNEIVMYTAYESFFPDDAKFSLGKSHSYTFKKSSGINSMLDIKLYTDALGVFGGKANGIAQTEIIGKFAVGRKGLANTGIRFFKFVGFNINATKFDSKLAYAPLDSNFTRTEMFQKNWFSAETFFTPISGWLARTSSDYWYLNLGCGVDLSEIASSKDTSTTLSTFITSQIGAQFDISNNAGFNLSVKGIAHFNPQTNDLGYGPLDVYYIRPQAMIYWFPAKNKTSRIFARATFIRNASEIKENFVQVQFGYSMLLSSKIK